MYKRVILDLLLFLFVITCPWWVTVLATIFLLFYFRTFNEIIIFGFLMDMYYGNLHLVFKVYDYRFTIAAIIVLIFASLIKRRIKYYLD